ncbi:FAD-dependent monooxygenase [Inquilinus sp. Marseille-Q2685]|uniref:FAD-dependent monooxygenase n=1 Tax=Inquilinus sp. Marseille-Q2685 TaxID=2866581 RepID=UPI001CE3BC01|nr:FAD-dependent monooxygenase [Inquilinus sp. Marseille-Q2685]
MRVVIVGAGIAGLAAARGLGLLGWNAEIYEQAPELKALGAGILLSANALRALRALHLYDAVVARAQPIHRLSLLTQDGRLLQTTDHLAFSRRYGHLSAATLHRGDLQDALLSQLPPSIIRTGKRCIDARQAGHGAILTFADGETVEADLVLACDGIHSAVRAAVFPGARERFAGYTCWRAVADGAPAGADRTHVTESWGAGVRFGLVPLRDGRLYWFACRGAARMDDPELARADLAALQRIFSGFHPPIPKVLQATPADGLIWTDISDLAPLSSFVRGRVVLLGDAAHAVTPDLGQGAGLAIEDAAVLAALLRRLPSDEALRSYDASRVGRAHKLAAGSRLYGRIAQWENPLAVRLRDLLVGSIPERLMDRQLDSILDVRFEPVGSES